MKVAVLGASDDPERYAYKAVVQLRKAGHEVFPVNPKLKSLEGLPVYPSLSALPLKMDTLTLYVGPERSAKLEAEILASSPQRIIFNPGAENPALAAKAAEKGIRPVEACTLVLLSTGQFDRA